MHFGENELFQFDWPFTLPTAHPKTFQRQRVRSSTRFKLQPAMGEHKVSRLPPLTTI